MKQNDSLLGVIATLWRWKKPIILITLLAAIGSVIVAMTLPVFYKANTTFYAAHQDQLKPEKMFGGSTRETYIYGGKEDIDRIITIGNSAELKDELISAFDLYDHYDIDPNSSSARFSAHDKLLELYSIQKTKHDAITIMVEDEDPTYAANLANAARENIDKINQNLITSRSQKTLTSFEKKIKERENLVKHLQDTLSMLQKEYGIVDILTQGETIAKIAAESEAELIKQRSILKSLEFNPLIEADTIAVLKARVQGLEDQYRSLTSTSNGGSFNLSKLNKGKPIIQNLQNMYATNFGQLAWEKDRYALLKMSSESEVSSVHLIDAAEPPVIKSRPKRSILVVGATLAAFIFSALLSLILNSYKNTNWKEVFDE